MWEKKSRFIVTTERLVLRPLRSTDIESLARIIYGDHRVSMFLPSSEDGPFERSDKSIKRYGSYWDSSGYGPWAITLKGNGEFIGRGGLKPFPETGDVELIYAVGVSSWGKGLAREVGRASLRFAFERIGAARVVAYTDIHNHRSQRVLYALGFQFMGVTATEFYSEPQSFFALPRAEWTPTEEMYEVFVEAHA